MASYIYQVIQTDRFVAEGFASRYSFADELLKASIAEWGILQPVVVVPQPENQFKVLSGLKRLACAKNLGLDNIPALVFQGERDPKKLFIISILFHWNQSLSDLDRALIFRDASKKMGFSDEDIFTKIFPALQLPAQRFILEEAKAVASLHPSVFDAIFHGTLPFRGIQSLTSFSPEDQSFFAKQIAPHFSFSTNQILKLVEWLFDYLKKNKRTLSDWVASADYQSILSLNIDKRQKTDKVMNLLKKLRFPKVVEQEGVVKNAAKLINEEKPGFTVEIPDALEKSGFQVKAEVRNPAALKDLLASLGDHEKALNSLFDLML